MQFVNSFPMISDNSSSFFLGNISFHMSNIKGYDLSRRHLLCIEAKTLTYTLFLLCHDFWWQTHFEFQSVLECKFLVWKVKYENHLP